MKTTDKVMIQAVAMSAALVGGLYWWNPDMHWGVYFGAWFLLSAGGYSELLKQTAHEKQANADDPKSKP